MAFLLNSQAQGVSGKNWAIYPNTTARGPWGAGPMQLHRLKAGPALDQRVLCSDCCNKNVLCLAHVVFSYFVLHSSKIP